jgi:hypothetical protein
MHPAPQCNTNVGVRDGMRAQRCGPHWHRRHRGARKGGGDVESREWPDSARPGAQSGPGTHLHHPNVMTSVARSTSHNHQDTKMMDPPRPSRDPADATGDDRCHPDAPTAPCNMPEGMRG